MLDVSKFSKGPWELVGGVGSELWGREGDVRNPVGHGQPRTQRGGLGMP